MPSNAGGLAALTMPELIRSLPDLETVFLETAYVPPICVHRHRPTTAPRAGLLVCRPMIADTDANEPREVQLARRCVADGVAVNRFFYRGTGDSYGDFATATFSDLVADAEVALSDLVRDLDGAPVAVQGSRLGALVAASLAQRHDLDLVLWDPTTKPAAHVKELLRTQMVHLMKIRESGYTASSLRAALDEGEMIDVFGWDFPGNVFRSLTDELESAIPDAGDSDRSVFAIFSQNAATADLGTLVPDGIEIERAEIGTREPLWLANFDLALSEPSLAFVEHTVSWVSSELLGSGRAPTVQTVDPRPAEFASGPRENPFFLEAGDERLAAYLTEPPGPANGKGLVIMPGAGHGTAAGPNRLWTRLARELADDGYRVLRFTYRATSNSTGENPVFDLAHPLVADGRAAVDAIRSTGVDEVSLLGWCYGGVTAAAACDDGIARLIMLSPSSRSNSMGIRSHADQRAESMTLGFMGRSLLSPSKWRSLVDAEQRLTYKRLISAKGRQLARGKRGGSGAGPEPRWLNHNFLDDLDRIARRSDTEVRIMFGRDDIDHRDYQEIRDGRISGIMDTLGDRVEVHRSNGSVHQLHTPAAQEAAMVTVRMWMAGVSADAPALPGDVADAAPSSPGDRSTGSAADLEAKVGEILLEQLGLEPEHTGIDVDSELMDEVGLDSVALIRFAISLEKAFKIEIDDDDLVIDNFGTTRRVAAYIQGRLEQ